MSEPTSSASWLARLTGGQAKQKLLAFASLIALLAIFTALKPDAFMTQDNIIGILQSTTVIGVLAIASTFIIITSGIDLSVGVLMTFCAVMAGIFLVNLGMPLPLGILWPWAPCLAVFQAWRLPSSKCRPLLPRWA
jgi:ribose transport system permease protein